MNGTARDPPSGETLARLIRHSLRAHILFAYTEGVTSPRRVATSLSAALNVVSYHTQVLHRTGAIELVRTEPRRGATEHFYRAVLPVDLEDAEWASLPVKLRRVLARAMIDEAMRQSADALARGGMDGDPTHLSRTYLMLDPEGQRALASLLREALARANAIGVASRERATEDLSPYELIILSFHQRPSSP